MIVADESTLSFGGNVSLTELMETLRDVSAKYEFYAYALHVANHIDLIASVPVRNVSILFIDHKLEMRLKCFTCRPVLLREI